MNTLILSIPSFTCDFKSTFQVSNVLFSYNDQYIKSILFHEFTHIYDTNITFKEIINNENLISAINAYTEYHASQIEILSNIGYNSIFAKK